jgi:hypothetical protein
MEIMVQLFPTLNIKEKKIKGNTMIFADFISRCAMFLLWRMDKTSDIPHAKSIVVIGASSIPAFM